MRPCVRKYEGHKKRLLCLRLCGDRYLFSTSQDNVLKMWNTESGTLVKNFKGHSKSINAIELTRDEQFVFTASSDNTTKMWDIRSGKCVSNSY